MKTIVLDDDPTGTQSATGVTVLLESDADLLTDALRHADSVYVQTNSRALDESTAVALIRRIRADGEEAARRLGVEVRFVLRGDSTLRGHVFAETEVLLDGDAVMLFVPAFPDGGRTTRDGVHLVRVDGVDVPAHESEYADDPVFGFSTGVLVDYIGEKSGRPALSVPLSTVRGGTLAETITGAPAGTVIAPDAVDADDIAAIARAVDAATAAGSDDRRPVRRAARGGARRRCEPFAASHATRARHGPVLLVCGSHTAGASAQLEPLVASWGAPAVIDTDAALREPEAAGLAAARTARAHLDSRPLAIVTSERSRSASHNTLAHGEKVMAALTTAVRALLPDVRVVVSKGGITSAEVARVGIGASSAVVLGQVLPGVSVWRLTAHDGRELLYVVVPGNVGAPDTLVRVLDALRVRAAADAAVVR